MPDFPTLLNLLPPKSRKGRMSRKNLEVENGQALRDRPFGGGLETVNWGLPPGWVDPLVVPPEEAWMYPE